MIFYARAAAIRAAMYAASGCQRAARVLRGEGSARGHAAVMPAASRLFALCARTSAITFAIFR